MVEPKVQEPVNSRRGHAPRTVVIERIKKVFSQIGIEDALATYGLDLSQGAQGMLPLEPFDDKRFDCRSPEEWLRLCCKDKLPGRALR